MFRIEMICMAAVFLAGCSHMHRVQGDEPQSEIPAGIRVGIGGKEVKEGDKVKVLRSVCDAGTKRACHDLRVGEATVLKVLDHDSAIVRPEGGLVMDETMRVEIK